MIAYPFSHVAMCTTPHELDIIRSPQVNLAIWPREMPHELARLVRYKRHRLLGHHIHETVPFRGAVSPIIRAQFSSFGSWVQPLVDDIALLARIFRGIVFDEVIVDHDVSRGRRRVTKALHIDSDTVTGVCRYTKPGMNYLPEGASMQSLGAGWLALVKGDRYGKGHVRGALHGAPRSHRGDPSDMALMIRH